MDARSAQFTGRAVGISIYCVFAKKAYGKEHTAESIQWFRLKVFEALLDPIAILLIGRIVI